MQQGISICHSYGHAIFMRQKINYIHVYKEQKDFSAV